MSDTSNNSQPPASIYSGTVSAFSIHDTWYVLHTKYSTTVVLVHSTSTLISTNLLTAYSTVYYLVLVLTCSSTVLVLYYFEVLLAISGISIYCTALMTYGDNDSRSYELL